jgi:purine-binding chemotaxis protein CheW
MIAFRTNQQLDIFSSIQEELLKMSKNLLPSDQALKREKQDAGMGLKFRLDNKEYWINICCVEEVIGMQKITEIPGLPSFVKGSIELHGHDIPVIDMRLLYRMTPKTYGKRTCIIIINSNSGAQAGLIVDSVSEVCSIAQS